MKVFLEIKGKLIKDKIESERFDYVIEDKEVYIFKEEKEDKFLIEIPKIIVKRGILKEGEVVIKILEDENKKVVQEKEENKDSVYAKKENLEIKDQEIKKIIEEIERLKKKFKEYQNRQ